MEKWSDIRAKMILDIDCGTGTHARLLAERGYLVTGIDGSREMIKIAKAHTRDGLQFRLGHAQTFNLGATFDAVLSLFHVVSYQVSNVDLQNMFINAARYCRTGALFIFDRWYGPTFKPEIEVLMQVAGLKFVHYEEWLTARQPGLDTWGVCFIGNKL
jgi:SAM-dependent methyltransferase